MNACLHVFPGVIVKGCYFHYAQCLWRRIQGIGLSVSYRENADHRNWFHMLLTMPFVPMPHVKDAFQFVKNTALDVPRVQEFNDSFDRTWMNGQYPTEICNFFKCDGPRTITLKGIIHDSCGKQARYTPISMRWSSCSAKKKPHHSSPSSS